MVSSAITEIIPISLKMSGKLKTLLRRFLMGRTYQIGEKELPSVTTILSILDKPALMPWAAKTTAAAFKEAVINSIDCLSEELLDNIEQEAKGAYRKKSTEAMDIGTRVHKIIESWIHSDGLLTPDEVIDPYAKRGLEAFLTWGEQHDIEIVSNEQVVTDDMLYAGRYDLLAKVDGKLTLIDFKTASGIWFSNWLQLGGYAIAIDEPVEEIAVLRIDKETGDLEYQSRTCWMVYAQAFVQLARYYETHKRLEEIEKEIKRGNKDSKHKK